MTSPLLAVEDLHVHFAGANGTVRAIDGVSFALEAGKTLAIVGETGSGKTTLARALLGLHPLGSTSGSIRFAGEELLTLREQGWRSIRWKRLALAVQNSTSAFDPVYRAGEQLIETIVQHLSVRPSTAKERAHNLITMVGLQVHHLNAYPHQLSGGEKQRLMLAMALSCDPELLILDEATSGQDMLSRKAMIQLLQRIQHEHNISMLLISHDLAAAAALADEVAVLYGGKLMEAGASHDLLTTPRHPYTWGLLNAYPNMTTTRDLYSIRGHMPNPSNPPTGCRFHPRCTQAIEQCRHDVPPLVMHNNRQLACHLGGLQALLEAEKLNKHFSLNRYSSASEQVHAVSDVSLTIYEGEVVALVGETGSGKTTLGRLLTGLLSADNGSIRFMGQDLNTLKGKPLKQLRQKIQAIPQDPFDSVNPLFMVRQIIREPLDIQQIGSRAERENTVLDAMLALGLPTDDDFLSRRPQELSGGQLQRVVIARALVLQPKLLIADEPVSMLDPSEQARLMNVLKHVQNEQGMGLLLISHDLALVRKVANRILVMQQGRIIEQGVSSTVISYPQHAHTRDLIAAAPIFEPEIIHSPRTGLIIINVDGAQHV